MALATPGVHSADELDVVVDVLSAHVEPLGQNLMADKVINSDEPSIESQENRAGLSAVAEQRAGRARAAGWLRVVWCSRKFSLRATWISLVLATSIAFLIPERFQSSARLMPPDQGSSCLAMLSASGIGAQLESGLSSLAGDLECIEKSLSKLASKSAALDIPTEGKARVPGLAVAVILQPMLRTLCRTVQNLSNYWCAATPFTIICTTCDLSIVPENTPNVSLKR